jgi:endo-alpha-1,4-polygalactosaminidase (GH114 family)
MQLKLQQQLAVEVAHTANVVSAVAELVDYQRQHQEILELVERNPVVVLVEFPATDTQELPVLHTKVEIQRMKAAAVVVVTSAAVAVEITQVVLVDLATSHF